MQPESSGVGRLHNKLIKLAGENDQHLNQVLISPFLFSRPHPFLYLLSSLVYLQGRKRRHLLATLRTLEAASLSQKSPSPPGSDSEEEVGRKNKYLRRPSLANASKEVGEKRKRKCQKQLPSTSDSESKEVERKCCRQTLGGISAEEEKGKRKCQKYSHSHSSQHLDSVDQTGTSVYVFGVGV